MSALPIINKHRRTTEHSVLAMFLGCGNPLYMQLYRRNVPLLYTSRYVNACDSVFVLLVMKTLEDEWHVIAKAYKFSYHF